MGKSIFVIDDYPINLLIAKNIIKHQGFFDIMIPYSEAHLALEYIVNHKDDKKSLPDVILLDLNMPVMDGWQFLNEFEELFPTLIRDIDIYILSSSMNVLEIKRSKQYQSVNGFLSKPLTLEMIQDVMTTNIANSSLIASNYVCFQKQKLR